MKDYAFSAEAEDELTDALAYHAAHWAGTGRNVYADFQAGIDAVRHAPTAYPPHRRGERLYPLAPLPYLLVYVDLPGFVWFKAVAHTSRRRGYWWRRQPPRN